MSKLPVQNQGETVKRLEARASLQQPYNDQITTPRQLVNWCKTNMQSMNFKFVTELEFTEDKKLLFKRNSTTKPIYGILNLHVFCNYIMVNQK
jgi:hypothetical protein